MVFSSHRFDTKSDVYIKPIFVKDLETLNAKSSNIYVYGYKLIVAVLCLESV